jgi:transposase
VGWDQPINLDNQQIKNHVDRGRESLLQREKPFSCTRSVLTNDSGELSERRLAHREEAEQFYGKLREQGLQVRVGMEASGYARWFERLLGELQFELWIGNAAEIRTKRVRKQKTDRQDAQLLLRLLIEDRLPRI